MQRLYFLLVVMSSNIGRGDRAVEGARLESVCAVKGTVGSNPTLSDFPFWSVPMTELCLLA